MRILVAYASKHGATKGIAERIASTLGTEGLDVTLRSVREPIDVDEFDAYVVGSAAYMGGWLDEATSFVRRHADALSRKPVWLFSSGPVGTEKFDKQGRDVLAASRPAQFAEFEPTIHPRGMQVFFGAYDPDAPAIGTAERIGQAFLRWIPAARGAIPVGDFRDWPAIEAWARAIAEALTPVAVAAA
jgi:menaquinone-dependent protoporphyrinogen oxidase